jgi:hypothetical protein
MAVPDSYDEHQKDRGYRQGNGQCYFCRPSTSQEHRDERQKNRHR